MATFTIIESRGMLEREVLVLVLVLGLEVSMCYRVRGKQYAWRDLQ